MAAASAFGSTFLTCLYGELRWDHPYCIHWTTKDLCFFRACTVCNSQICFGDWLLFAFCERVPRFRTIGRISEDLFRDVELILCSSGPVFHPSPALHGKVDIAGNRWHWLSLDGYHWTGTSKLWARWLVFVLWWKKSSVILTEVIGNHQEALKRFLGFTNEVNEIL